MDYEIWKGRFKAFLHMRDCLSAIESCGEKPTGIDDSKWSKIKWTAKGYIVSALGDDCLRLTTDAGDPCEIMKMLNEEFMKANIALSTMRMRDLFLMRMSYDKDPDAVFQSVQKICE
mgnify:CR=1 FL=1